MSCLCLQDGQSILITMHDDHISNASDFPLLRHGTIDHRMSDIEIDQSLGNVVQISSKSEKPSSTQATEMVLGKEGDENSSEGSDMVKLPEEIVMRVLARLPVAQLFRARAVCKQWNILTLTPEFLEVSREMLVPQYSYFPVIASRAQYHTPSVGRHIESRSEGNRNRSTFVNVFFGYNHSLKKWQRLPPLDFLPQEARVPVASSKGLVCFRGDASLFLCNPVVRTWKELPLITYKWPPSVSAHIVVDRSTDSYKVIIAGKIRHNFVTDMVRSVAVYESKTNAWRVVGAQHPLNVFSYGPTAAVCGNSLYCEAICSRGELGVMMYDIENEVWDNDLHEISRDDRGDYQLTQVVECGGSIYMVLGRGFGGIVTLVYILKLESETLEGTRRRGDGNARGEKLEKVWRQVTRLTENFLEDLRDVWFGEDDAAVACVGHGSQICIVAGTSLLLVYDVNLDVWSKGPSLSQAFGPSEDWDNAEPIQFPIELQLTSLV